MYQKTKSEFLRTMGKTQSKQNNENGDLQLTAIVQNQEDHTDEHGVQTLLLWVILFVVLVQLIITVYGAYKKREEKIALNAAKSIAALNA